MNSVSDIWQISAISGGAEFLRYPDGKPWREKTLIWPKFPDPIPTIIRKNIETFRDKQVILFLGMSAIDHLTCDFSRGCL